MWNWCTGFFTWFRLLLEYIGRWPFLTLCILDGELWNCSEEGTQARIYKSWVVSTFKIPHSDTPALHPHPYGIFWGNRSQMRELDSQSLLARDMRKGSQSTCTGLWCGEAEPFAVLRCVRANPPVLIPSLWGDLTPQILGPSYREWQVTW